MKALKYSRYFLYLLTNWNFNVAWHILRQEIKGEKKYGIATTGADELAALEDKGIDISHATIYMPASYDMLEDIFSKITNGSKHLLDIGCGKGRVLCVAPQFGINKLTGIDFSKEFCETAKENLELVRKKFPHINYKIENNDAFYYAIPLDTDCIFFFNPFDDTIMSGVVENIMISLEKKPRDITVIYLNPLNKELFLNKGFKEIYHTRKLHYLEGIILKRNKES